MIESTRLLKGFALLQKDKQRCIFWWTLVVSPCLYKYVWIILTTLLISDTERLAVNGLKSVFLEVLKPYLADFLIGSVLFLNGQRGKMSFENRMS